LSQYTREPNPIYSAATAGAIRDRSAGEIQFLGSPQRTRGPNPFPWRAAVGWRCRRLAVFGRAYHRGLPTRQIRSTGRGVGESTWSRGDASAEKPHLLPQWARRRNALHSKGQCPMPPEGPFAAPPEQPALERTEESAVVRKRGEPRQHDWARCRVPSAIRGDAARLATALDTAG